MMPRHLLESDEREPAALFLRVISGGGRADLRHELRRKQRLVQAPRFEGHVAPQNLGTVIAGHAHRRNPARDLVRVELDRSSHIHRAIGQINRALDEFRKIANEPAIDGDDLVWLAAEAGDFTGRDDIGAIAITATESVAGQFTGSGGRPGHDHAAIKPTREGHADRFAAAKIAFQDVWKAFPQPSVVIFRGQAWLAFPFVEIEIFFFRDRTSWREGPA